MENLDVNIQPTLRSAARRGRSARRSATTPIVSLNQRKIPRYKLLEETALVAIEAQADWILDQVGVEFRGDKVALELFRQAGARVNGQRVTF
ncbi:MAG: trimethylamine methyltransferase family protein, partial [Pseudomonadota bacterium]